MISRAERLAEVSHIEIEHALEVAVERMSRDLLKAASTMGADEARFLVDSYYAVQTTRIAMRGQQRALGESEEPTVFISYIGDQQETVEKQIRRALNAWAEQQEPSAWAMTICGIGPVIAAGLGAHIDIEQAPTAGHIWRFAGLDPSTNWGKGEKRPWNAELKRLCWIIGESFVKVSGNDNDIYGQVYLARKAQEITKNDAGAFADQAAAGAKRVRKSTEAYKHYAAGKLPPGHIHARAKRYAVKLFLSHYQHVAFESHYGEPPPKPYILTQGGHAHFIAPPNWPME